MSFLLDWLWDLLYSLGLWKKDVSAACFACACLASLMHHP